MQAQTSRRLATVAALLIAAQSATASFCCGSQDADGAKAKETLKLAQAGAEGAAAQSGKSREPGETATLKEPAAPKEPGRMLDVFQQLNVGDWVRTHWTNDEDHELIVVAKTDQIITIEEIVHTPKSKAPIAWTQLDVRLEDGALVALRERHADGTLVERKPDPDAQQGTSNLLLQPFRPDGEDELNGLHIEVHAPGQDKPEIQRGLFRCRRYKITVEPRRYARLWFSRWKLPGYPVKIVYYEKDLTIMLEAFGTGRVSEFGKAN